MIARTALRAVLLAAALALATLVLGWWGVPVAAAAWGALARGARGSAVAAALGGGAAWGALLLREATAAPLWPFAETLGGVVGIPGVVLVAATLLFPAILAWSATVVTGSLTRPRRTATSGNRAP